MIVVVPYRTGWPDEFRLIERPLPPGLRRPDGGRAPVSASHYLES